MRKSLLNGVALYSILATVGCGQSAHPLPLNIAVTPQLAAVAAGQTVQLTATVTNTVSGTSVAATANDDESGVRWSASAGTVDVQGNFSAPSGSESSISIVTATSRADRTKSATATIHIVASGQVSTTANGQVALYSITPGDSAMVSVSFGLDTNYGLTTWTQPASQSAPVSIFVAGMKANTPYHMAASVRFADGVQFTDTDHVFTTTEAEIPEQAPSLTVTNTPGLTPQGGVEVLDLSSGVARPTIADLNGNILWAYTQVPDGLIVNPIKLLSKWPFPYEFQPRNSGWR